MTETAFVLAGQFKPGFCINCGKPVAPQPGSLFCDEALHGRRGERCRQIAELIRYARRKIADGTRNRPDIAAAIASRKAQLVSGFYDKAARKVAPEARRELLARSKGKCEKCGEGFTVDGEGKFTVQHTASGEGMKLEAWCWRCNVDHSLSYVMKLTEEDLAYLEQFDMREHGQTPLLVCDNHLTWPLIYRDLMKAARETAIGSHGYSPRRNDDGDCDEEETPILYFIP